MMIIISITAAVITSLVTDAATGSQYLCLSFTDDGLLPKTNGF